MQHQAVLLGVVVAAAALIGLAPVLLTPAGILLLLALGFAALGVIVLQRSLRRRAEAPPAEDVAEDVATVGGAQGPDQQPRRDLRVARALFFAGALTVTQAEWRVGVSLTISEICFIGAFACCAFAVLRGHPIARVPSWLVAGVMIFTVGGAISSVGATSPPESTVEVMQGIYVMLLWAWTGAMVIGTRHDLMVVFALWVASAAANGLAAAAQAGGLEVLTGPLEGGRATGFTQHPNDLGGAEAVALLPALLLATPAIPQTRLRSLGCWILVGLCATGLVLSGSMAGMLGALVGTVVWLAAPAIRTPARIGVVSMGALAVLLVGVIGGSFTSPTERLQQVTTRSATNPDSGSGDERIENAKAAWSRIKESPLVGSGLDRTGKVVDTLSGGRTVTNQVHGAPVAAWYQAGLFGLIGVVVIFGALLAAGWRSVRMAISDDGVVIGLTLLASFVAFFVYAMSSPFVFQQSGWIAAVLLVAWRAHCRKLVGARAAETAEDPGRAYVPVPRLVTG